MIKYPSGAGARAGAGMCVGETFDQIEVYFAMASGRILAEPTEQDSC